MPTEWLWLSNDVATMMPLLCHTVVQVSYPPLFTFIFTTEISSEILDPNAGDRKRRDTVTLEDLLRSTDRYNRDDPKIGVKQITTGFKKWAMRYIGNCHGQRVNEYQIDRMERWNSKLQEHLDNYYAGDKVMNVM